MRTAFINTLLEKNSSDDRIVFLTADLGFMAVEPLRKVLGDRFINMGLAEANMIGVAAGLARAGFKPYVYSMIPFVTMRCLEHIRVSLCQNENKVILIGVGAGYSYGNQGASHHAVEDIGVMSSLPGMTVISASDPYDVRQALLMVEEIDGPVYIRLGKNGEPRLDIANRTFELGKPTLMRKGVDGAFVCHGGIVATCLEVAENIQRDAGINLSVYNFHTIKPMDINYLESIIVKYPQIISVEQHTERGGLSSYIGMAIARSSQCTAQLETITILDEYKKICGSREYLESLDGLSAKSIYENILKLYGLKTSAHK